MGVPRGRETRHAGCVRSMADGGGLGRTHHSESDEYCTARGRTRALDGSSARTRNSARRMRALHGGRGWVGANGITRRVMNTVLQGGGRGPRGSRRDGVSPSGLGGCEEEGRAHCPNAQRGGARGRTEAGGTPHARGKSGELGNSRSGRWPSDSSTILVRTFR